MWVIINQTLAQQRWKSTWEIKEICDFLRWKLLLFGLVNANYVGTTVRTAGWLRSTCQAKEQVAGDRKDLSPPVRLCQGREEWIRGTKYNLVSGSLMFFIITTLSPRIDGCIASDNVVAIHCCHWRLLGRKPLVAWIHPPIEAKADSHKDWVKETIPPRFVFRGKRSHSIFAWQYPERIAPFAMPTFNLF